ncbi:dual specificity protein phosphatase 16-like [Branchiostoma floridae]|uniref:Dual specificity protein phosphatase 16-like n=2 Tax=Branchiostoma floridae TaxID=7739 RepID=A0A9J7KKI2_BRAFL|nr:dual specificity protein phosphatase 16-like [Branchiostoma floridae]
MTMKAKTASMREAMAESLLKYQANLLNCERLAAMLQGGLPKTLLIDSRSFLEYNTSHVLNSVNICCSKLMKRRLQQDKVSIREVLRNTCHVQDEEKDEVIVYDQCTQDLDGLSTENFLSVLLGKLSSAYKNVSLLTGGFNHFQSCFPTLCEGKLPTFNLPTLSQPCLPVANVGPTRILPFLYLGSQKDVFNREVMEFYEINYVLNTSVTCPKPDYVPDTHFLRIPVNDNYAERIFPWFDKIIEFIDMVRESNGCVVVHCMAGVSRSATACIAFVMKHLNLSSDDAYRYVKDKRPSISPNFNFLGQLLEFEKLLTERRAQSAVIQDQPTRLDFPQHSAIEDPDEKDFLFCDVLLDNKSNEARWKEGRDVSRDVSSQSQSHPGKSLSNTSPVRDMRQVKRSFSLNVKHCLEMPYIVPGLATGLCFNKQKPRSGTEKSAKAAPERPEKVGESSGSESEQDQVEILHDFSRVRFRRNRLRKSPCRSVSCPQGLNRSLNLQYNSDDKKPELGTHRKFELDFAQAVRMTSSPGFSSQSSPSSSQSSQGSTPSLHDPAVVYRQGNTPTLHDPAVVYRQRRLDLDFPSPSSASSQGGSPSSLGRRKRNNRGLYLSIPSPNGTVLDKWRQSLDPSEAAHAADSSCQRQYEESKLPQQSHSQNVDMIPVS